MILFVLKKKKNLHPGKDFRKNWYLLESTQYTQLVFEQFFAKHFLCNVFFVTKRTGRSEPCFTSVPEFVDPVFAKKSPKRAFSMTENERFGLVGAKTDI
jgi:hypothetical protein